jgi:hypothetical protein
LVHNHQHPGDEVLTRDMEQCLYADLFRAARRDIEKHAKQFEYVFSRIFFCNVIALFFFFFFLLIEMNRYLQVEEQKYHHYGSI